MLGSRLGMLCLAMAIVASACSGSAEPVTTTAAPTTTAPVTTVPVATAPPTTASRPEVAALALTVDRWALDNAVGAVAVGVVTPTGEIITVMASRNGIEWPVDSLFEVGSLTKTVVAATAVSLAARGVVDLDVPIATWLPDFPAADTITLRHLMGHTAGLQDGNAEPDPAELLRLSRPVAPEELIEQAGGLVGAIPAGTSHAYSNAGYWVVGAVLEAATGEPVAATIRAEVLEPLGLEDTYLAWSEDLGADLVPGEVAIGADTEPLQLGPEPLAGVITAAWSAGGIVSSAPDMAAFYGALFGGELLPEAWVGEMQAPSAGSGYGLGIERRRYGSLEAWGHNGAVPGYTASALRQESPDGYAVVVLANKLVVTSDGIQPDTETFAAHLLNQVVTLEL